MRRNDRETEIRMMTMEEYLKKRQAALKLVELLYN